jgi:hypothetical protein
MEQLDTTIQTRILLGKLYEMTVKKIKTNEGIFYQAIYYDMVDPVIWGKPASRYSQAITSCEAAFSDFEKHFKKYANR